MQETVVIDPPNAGRATHPVAAAAGNASLLGLGYLLLRRRGLATLAVLGTVLFVILLVTVRAAGVEIALGVWWLAVTVHGWLLARRSSAPAAQWELHQAPSAQPVGQRPSPLRQWAIALGVTLPLLLVVGLVRFDAARIDEALAAARTAGDCAAAGAATERVAWPYRVVDGPMTRRADTTTDACRTLADADRQLASVTGDTTPVDASLAGGFAGMTGVLRDQPGHEAMVGRVLDRFLATLPTANRCRVAATTDWLIRRQATGDALDRAGTAARTAAPAALVGCGDTLMEARNWAEARGRYQQLLDQYPGDPLRARAEEGVLRATQAIELDNVRRLLAGNPAYGSSPAYCSTPAPYSAAPPYGAGVNKALIFGNTQRTEPLPAEWRANDAADAVVIVCVGRDKADAEGEAVRTCPYTSETRGGLYNVTFRKVAVPVTVFELRTGRPVVETTLQIGGPSCPQRFVDPSGLVPAGDRFDFPVTPSPGDLRAAFAPLIER